MDLFFCVRRRHPQRIALCLGKGPDQTNGKSFSQGRGGCQRQLCNEGRKVRAPRSFAKHAGSIDGQCAIDRLDPVELAVETQKRARKLDGTVPSRQHHVLREHRRCDKTGTNRQ